MAARVLSASDRLRRAARAGKVSTAELVALRRTLLQGAAALDELLGGAL